MSSYTTVKMAAAAITDIPEELQCQICFEEFTNPKVLDCKHVFCCKCLEKWMKENKTMTCLVCEREEGALRRGEKIEDLPEPLYFTKLNEASTRFMTASLAVTGDRMCDVCKQGKAAGYFCHNCGKNMCEQCEEKHSAEKPYQNHKVIQLSKHTVCSEHKGELKTLYCHDCQVGICNLCFEVAHDHHNVTDAQEAIPAKTEKLQIFKKTTEQIRKYIVQYESELKTEDINLQAEYRSAERELEDVQRKLNEVIEVKGDVQQKLQAEKEKLLFHMRDVEDAKATQVSLLKYIDDILNKGSDMDILSAADDIPSMSTNVSLFPPKLDIPNVRGDDVIEQCKSLVQYGTPATVESFLIQSKEDEAAVGGPILSLSEVSTECRLGTKLWERKIACLSFDTLYDEKTGDVWISTASKAVGLVKYNLQGDILSEVVKGTPVYFFSLDTKRDSFIANIGQGSIASISKSGDIIRQVTIPGAGDLQGQAYLPDRGWLAICDRIKHCVWFIDAERMEVVKQIGSQGSGDDQFNKPVYVCYHSVAGSPVIVVGDLDNHCVKVLDTQGQYIRKYGSRGSGDRELKGPEGVCVDNKGRILICDVNNMRVVRFPHSDDREQWEVVVTPDQLGGLYPFGVCVTNKGHLAVTTVTVMDGKPVPPSYLSLFSYQ